MIREDLNEAGNPAFDDDLGRILSAGTHLLDICLTTSLGMNRILIGTLSQLGAFCTGQFHWNMVFQTRAVRVHLEMH